MSVLAGRTIVITGAARGIGAALAQEVAARGAVPALIGHEPDELARIATRCGPRARWWEADVTDGARLAAVAAEVTADLGAPDVVVANAGIAIGGPFLTTDAAAFDRIVEVNLLGSIRTARAFGPALVQRRGYLLQIASLAAIAAAPTMAAYCASKSGVEAFARAVGAEVAHQGASVGIAYLSWIDTDMVRGADAIRPSAQARQQLPPPFNRTYPVAAAASTLADGIERRRPHVYFPRWTGALAPVRGLLPALMSATGRRAGAEAARAYGDAVGGGAGGAVGAGGAADDAARATPQSGPPTLRRQRAG